MHALIYLFFGSIYYSGLKAHQIAFLISTDVDFWEAR